MKKIFTIAVLLIILSISSFSVFAQKQAPEQLPGKGLLEHDFFYAGENVDNKSMYIVKGGVVTWSYTHPGKGEISDAVLLSDSSIVFAHLSGVTKISKDKKIIWNYDSPPGCEIHTAQPIGKDRVLFIQSGTPSKLMVVNIVTGKTEKEFVLPTGDSGVPHRFFRHARLTNNGTIVIAHLDLETVTEYDINGKEIWSMPSPGAWSAVPLKNGNILIAGGKEARVTEVDRKKNVVWQFSASDFPGFKFSDMQVAVRLANGHTLVNNRSGKGDGTAVQAIEVDTDKKMVWALHSWSAPVELNSSTIIQVLDKNEIAENVRFGNIK